MLSTQVDQIQSATTEELNAKMKQLYPKWKEATDKQNRETKEVKEEQESRNEKLLLLKYSTLKKTVLNRYLKQQKVVKEHELLKIALEKKKKFNKQRKIRGTNNSNYYEKKKKN